MNNQFIRDLNQIIESDDEQRLDTLFNDETNEEFRSDLLANFWDATISLSCYVTDEHAKANDKLVVLCINILCYIAEHVNCKEFLIVILEQLDMFKDDSKFLGLLDPLIICLKRHDPEKSRWVLETSFDCILAHFKSIPLPDVPDNLEVDELPLVWNAPETFRHTYLMLSVIDSIENYLSDRENLPWNSRSAILRNILKIFEYPLIYLDIFAENSNFETDSHKCARRLFQLSLKLVTSLSEFFKLALLHNEKQKNIQTDRLSDCSYDEIARQTENRTYSLIGLSCFLYMTFIEHLDDRKYPSVLSHWYRFKLVVSVIHPLFTNSSLFVQHLILKLFYFALSSLEENQISLDIWELDNYKTLLENLTNTMTLGKIKEIRSLSLDCFNSLLKCSEPEAKYRMLVLVLNKTSHTGVRSHIIKVFKDLVDLSLRGVLQSDVFLGKSLSRIYSDIFKLPEGIASDLVQGTDWILSSLNFLYYLVVADDSDKSHVWVHIDQIEDDFLTPLLKGIDMSHAHYKQERDNVANNELTNLEVSGMSMPPLTKEQKQEVMNSSLLTLDLIRSVRGRACEAISRRRRVEKFTGDSSKLS